MKFTGKQLTAILKLGIAMVRADGKVETNELLFVYGELKRFGADEYDIKLLTSACEEMQTGEMFATVIAMSDEQKKYVAAYLGVILASDGKADKDEIKLWNLTTAFCNLPAMTVGEAFEYMEKL